MRNPGADLGANSVRLDGNGQAGSTLAGLGGEGGHTADEMLQVQSIKCGIDSYETCETCTESRASRRDHSPQAAAVIIVSKTRQSGRPRAQYCAPPPLRGRVMD